MAVNVSVRVHVVWWRAYVGAVLMTFGMQHTGEALIRSAVRVEGSKTQQ